MLDLNKIRKNVHKELIQLDSLVIHNEQKTKASNIVIDDFFLDEDFFDEGPELHFRLRNVSGTPLENLEIEINFFDSYGGVVGTDGDIRLGTLKNEESDSFIFYINSPGQVSSAELNVLCNPQSLMNKLCTINAQFIAMICFTIFMVGLFFYFWKYVF